MNRHIIRTSETDSVKGLPSTQYVDVELKQTTKSLPFPNVSTVLSQRSVYEEERQTGNKFRLILTIVPYCSNVLFNPLTEIIKDEGSDDVVVVTDKSTQKISDTIGIDNPTRVHMISNTEYSSLLHGGYEYHPGYDFFDNHLFRNKTFKVVNPLTRNTDKNVFNTLKDYMRDRNGDTLKYNKRLSINSVNESQGFNNDKHLYLKDDVLTIDESINQNLYEDNGWWGFTNNTTIEPKELKNRKWYSLDIGKILNNHNSCEFIDMYPDRALFSFAPKFNKFTHKTENNWNVVVTYPYKNLYNHPLCLGGYSYIKRKLTNIGEFIEETVTEGNRWMGLKLMSVSIGSGKSGSNNIIFRTYTKHGLKQGELFYLYYTNPYKEAISKFDEKFLNGEEVYYESETYYKVTNVGDLSKNNDDYYFYSSNISIIKEIYKSYLRYAEKLIAEDNTDKIPFRELYYKDDKKDIFDSDNVLKTELLNKILKYSNFRIRRCVKGVKSTYYIRQFRKIPNLRAAQREMTEEESMHTSKFNGLFEEYITDNALDPTNPKFQRNLNSEMYQLGFASNIYNDNVAQITFTDGIDVKGLTDNLGRPLSELFYTVVKNNSGNEVWYHKEEPIYSNKDLKARYENRKDTFKKKYNVDYDGYKIEFSHCFGKITSGFEMFFQRSDTEEVTGPIKYLKKLSSVHHIANINNLGVSGSTDSPIEEDKDTVNLENNIKYTDTFFYGDIVEFNPLEFQENVISNVMHRFNTAQRETMNNENYSQYQFHEITEDDYDPIMNNDSTEAFEVTEYSAVNGNKDENMKTVDYCTISRPEGYYYRAHYPIKIREYTRIVQDSHRSIKVRKAVPLQNNGIVLKITTNVKHNLSENDIIYICDDANDIRYVTRCTKIIDKVNFLMSVDYSEIITNATDFEDKEISSNFNESVYKKETDNNIYKFIKKFSWLELCEILNGKYDEDLSLPKLILRTKNTNIPDYATYIGGNQYIWRNLVNCGDSQTKELPDHIFANGYFYITQSINFYLKRQDPFGTNGLYFDGEGKYPFFPNDPNGILQKENNFITKDTNVSC